MVVRREGRGLIKGEENRENEFGKRGTMVRLFLPLTYCRILLRQVDSKQQRTERVFANRREQQKWAIAPALQMAGINVEC